MLHTSVVITLLDLVKIQNVFFDNIMSLGYHPKISLHTRLGNNRQTLIDNIFTNNTYLD